MDSSWILGCDINQVKGFNASELKLTNVNQLCHVKSNTKGQFLFPSVPSGNYVLVPFYRTPNSLKFDVHPRNVRFAVSEDSHVFSKPFQVCIQSLMTKQRCKFITYLVLGFRIQCRRSRNLSSRKW